MARNLYLASLEAGGGKSVVALGLMELLFRRVDRIGYFRPVVPSGGAPDPRIELMLDRYELQCSHDDCYAYTADEVAELQAAGRTHDVAAGILDAYKRLERRHDFVLIEGTDYTGMTTALEFDFNARVANDLGAPVVALVNGLGTRPEDVLGAVGVARESLEAEGCTVAAIVVNRVDPAAREAVLASLAAEVAAHGPVYVLPDEPLLSMPTIGEVVEALAGRHVRGETGDLTREVTGYKVAAMTLPNVLDHVVDGEVMITPGDRADIIVGGLATGLASTYPNLSGLVLTGGLDPDPRITRLVDGLGTTTPVFAVDHDTYTAAQQISGLRAVIRPENARKIASALGLFEAHVDLAALADRIEVTRSGRVTPLMFEYELIEGARTDRRHIVLPEGTDDRVLQAAHLLRRRDVCDLTILGREADVRGRADALGLDLGDVPVVDPSTSDRREEYAERYRELRAHKGVTAEAAAEVMLDVSYFGTMMVHQGAVDGMVSGAAHSTGHTIRPAFEFIRTRPDAAIVSSVFFMCLADRVLVYGDCAIVPNPDAAQLADIALSSSRTAATFGITPRVAMLSYSTGESGTGADVDRVREATRLVREQRPDLPVAGPIQYDAAIDASVARAKMPGNDVAGQATVFVFPDLNTGNNTYKAVQRSAGAVAVGPVLQGLNKPVNDLSRGCMVPDIVNTVAITAIQAHEGSA